MRLNPAVPVYIPKSPPPALTIPPRLKDVWAPPHSPGPIRITSPRVVERAPRTGPSARTKKSRARVVAWQNYMRLKELPGDLNEVEEAEAEAERVGACVVDAGEAQPQGVVDILEPQPEDPTFDPPESDLVASSSFVTNPFEEPGVVYVRPQPGFGASASFDTIPLDDSYPTENPSFESNVSGGELYFDDTVSLISLYSEDFDVYPVYSGGAAAATHSRPRATTVSWVTDHVTRLDYPERFESVPREAGPVVRDRGWTV